jgi:hypothetical protein
MEKWVWVNCCIVKEGEEGRTHIMVGQMNKSNWKTVRAEEKR